MTSPVGAQGDGGRMCAHGERKAHDLWVDHQYWDNGHGQQEHAPYCNCVPRVCPGLVGAQGDDETARCVIDRDGDLWQRYAPGSWRCLTAQSFPVAGGDLLNICGPLTDLDVAGLGAVAAAQSAMIDHSYPPELSREARLWRRIAKAGEEHGEVLEALYGLLGENPRKGVTGGPSEVIAELLDEAFAALAAVEHLTGNAGRSLDLLVEHGRSVAARLAAAIGASHE